MARAISRKISRPLDHLGAVTAQVAAGNLQVQAQTPAKDEIRQLVDSFNHMIRELAANREKLIVAERLAAWREVARQVSHEIKNPLTPIQLALYRVRQRLGEAFLGQEAVQESFQSIEEELASLRHLADEFSEFARLPRAELKPDHLNDIIQLTARLHEGSARNVHVKLDLAFDLPERQLDREQIKRLLNNLIKNAIEAASHKPCEITISTRKDAGRVRMIFSDNGPGLTPEMMGKIFTPNFTTKRSGSGLGLVMVKRIVEEHGGMITVESAAAKGTRFSIVI
jgi:nitrogen fixation/metabolism regulation signal transduction histidine kinase